MHKADKVKTDKYSILNTANLSALELCSGIKTFKKPSKFFHHVRLNFINVHILKQLWFFLLK